MPVFDNFEGIRGLKIEHEDRTDGRVSGVGSQSRERGRQESRKKQNELGAWWSEDSIRVTKTLGTPNPAWMKTAPSGWGEDDQKMILGDARGQSDRGDGGKQECTEQAARALPHRLPPPHDHDAVSRLLFPSKLRSSSKGLLHSGRLALNPHRISVDMETGLMDGSPSRLCLRFVLSFSL